MSKNKDIELRVLDRSQMLQEPEKERVIVTPEMARMFLSKSRKNRPIRQPVVDKYADKMRRKMWRFTGDAIRFDWDGNLIDGQHRLHACVSANVAFETLIVRGLDPEVMDVIDTGNKRAIGAILHIKGYASSHYVAATSRWLMAIKNGGVSKQRAYDSLDILMIAERHPLIIESINKSAGAFGCGRLSLVTALHYVGVNLLNKEKEADSFLKVFTSPSAPTYEGDPAVIWREHCLRARKAGATLDGDVAYPNLLTAFNLHMIGKKTSSPWKMRNGAVIITGLNVDHI